MKSRILFVTTAFSVALIMFAFRQGMEPDPQTQSANNYLKWNGKGCSPDWQVLEKILEETEIPPIPGAGIYKWSISTKSDSAQFYFNQGINMFYAFHIIESMASFKKATKFDPECGMLYWAQALAYGPNINDLGYSASPEALVATAKAVEFSSKCTEREKTLINAQSIRYSSDSTQSRAKLNQDYVDKMKAAYEKYPGDADVAALYVDALMLQHPWDLWKIDGTPKPWTPLIRQVLEKLLAKTPNHPGANHYYIHVMEPSPYYAKALPSADRLGKLTPGLSHTVHMPSHIYLRGGQYGKGVAVNVSAVASYNRSIPLYAPVTGNDFLYIIHNLHMQTNHAMLAADWETSVRSANETVKSINPEYLNIPDALGNYVQYIYMTPTLVNVRFGKWKELLDDAPPTSNAFIYANVLFHFGRGMAYANLGEQSSAKNELQMMRDLMKDSVLRIPLTPFASSFEGATVAENLLAGTVAMKAGNYDAAIKFLKIAVEVEENMVYNEPRDWLLNPKHYLGDAYLKAGRYKESVETLKKDLLNNNDNAWALHGLLRAYQMDKRSSDVNLVMQKISKLYPKKKLEPLKLTGAVL